jgi:hypothetical protein
MVAPPRDCPAEPEVDEERLHEGATAMMAMTANIRANITVCFMM